MSDSQTDVGGGCVAVVGCEGVAIAVQLKRRVSDSYGNKSLEQVSGSPFLHLLAVRISGMTLVAEGSIVVSEEKVTLTVKEPGRIVYVARIIGRMAESLGLHHPDRLIPKKLLAVAS